MEMEFVQNLPFFSIILSLISGPISTVLSAKWARRLNLFVITMIGIMSTMVFSFTLRSGESYVYRMGHFPAPWGNEIRIGQLEGVMAIFFCVIMFLCMIGGTLEQQKELEDSKKNLYYVMVDLLLCSLLALIYTNDLFTAYVFVEINTIAACGLIMVKQNGISIFSSLRYLLMNVVGSGLFLLGVCFLYDITGHLLMSNIQAEVAKIYESGAYHVPLMVAIGLVTVGLAIKSGLYPFHTWIPDAYGNSTVSSASILSSLVSKGYIFLVVKIFYRVIGFDVIRHCRVVNVLFVFGVAGMIMGSVSAIREKNIRKMIAFSSVAQIGYIYMGFGLDSTAGMIASIYHIFAHAATKSLLFMAASGLTDTADGSTEFKDLTGAGYRNRIAGVAFTVGALSMVGFPLFAGFISKILFAHASLENNPKMLVTLIALAISTILNAVYFLKTAILIYTPMEKDAAKKKDYKVITVADQPQKAAALLLFIVVQLILGLNSEPIVELIQRGLEMFG